MENTEKRAVTEILEQPTTLTLGGRTFRVPPPSYATLLRVSQLVTQMPQNDINPTEVTESQLVAYVINNAKDYQLLPELLATLLVGVHKTFPRALKNKRIRPLSKWIAERVPPSEQTQAISTLLSRLEIADFFWLTTFLSKMRVAKPTREVGETEATAPGV